MVLTSNGNPYMKYCFDACADKGYAGFCSGTALIIVYKFMLHTC
jgi:hypothetical protein